MESLSYHPSCLSHVCMIEGESCSSGVKHQQSCLSLTVRKRHDSRLPKIDFASSFHVSFDSEIIWVSHCTKSIRNGRTAIKISPSALNASEFIFKSTYPAKRVGMCNYSGILEVANAFHAFPRSNVRCFGGWSAGCVLCVGVVTSMHLLNCGSECRMRFRNCLEQERRMWGGKHEIKRVMQTWCHLVGKNSTESNEDFLVQLNSVANENTAKKMFSNEWEKRKATAKLMTRLTKEVILFDALVLLVSLLLHERELLASREKWRDVCLLRLFGTTSQVSVRLYVCLSV